MVYGHKQACTHVNTLPQVPLVWGLLRLAPTSILEHAYQRAFINEYTHNPSGSILRFYEYHIVEDF